MIKKYINLANLYFGTHIFLLRLELIGKRSTVLFCGTEIILELEVVFSSPAV